MSCLIYIIKYGDGYRAETIQQNRPNRPTLYSGRMTQAEDPA